MGFVYKLTIHFDKMNFIIELVKIVNVLLLGMFKLS